MGKKGTNGETAKFRDEKTAAFYRAAAEFLPPERLFTDALRTLAWGTDAGFYRQIPQIVVFPKNEEEAALWNCGGPGTCGKWYGSDRGGY